MKLPGAVALVTGGATGIGKAIAARLRARGAEVALMGRRRALLVAAAESMGALALPGDVSKEQDVASVVAACVQRFGRLDVLINNAGFGYFAPLVEIERTKFDALLATNLTGAMLMARECAKHFVAQKSGHLVNVASTSALRGDAEGTAYAASKFALRGMSECWRAELRRHDVRVMLVNPSEVLTDFASAAGFQQESSPHKLRPEDVAHAVVAALEMDERGFLPELSVWATNPF